MKKKSQKKSLILKKNNSTNKNITTIKSAIEVKEIIKSIFKKKYV